MVLIYDYPRLDRELMLKFLIFYVGAHAIWAPTELEAKILYVCKGFSCSVYTTNIQQVH